MDRPGTGDDWVALTADALPVAVAHDWIVVPRCGGQVVFSGTVRDHSEGRPGVSALEYEAYAVEAERRLRQLAEEVRRRWPVVGRVVLWHRSGRMEVGETAVVAAVSAPHRHEAFEAARWAIDTLKATVPIWKHEQWEGGADWGTGAALISGAAATSEVAP